jgi:hypothetical protein
MNLLERMSQADAVAVKEFSAKYPLTGGDLVKELKRKDSWLDLSYRSVTQLCSVLKSSDYSPIFIDNLFINK